MVTTEQGDRYRLCLKLGHGSFECQENTSDRLGDIVEAGDLSIADILDDDEARNEVGEKRIQ